MPINQILILRLSIFLIEEPAVTNYAHNGSSLIFPLCSSVRGSHWLIGIRIKDLIPINWVSGWKEVGKEEKRLMEMRPGVGHLLRARSYRASELSRRWERPFGRCSFSHTLGLPEFSVCPTPDGRLGYFQLVPVLSSTATSILVCVSVHKRVNLFLTLDDHKWNCWILAVGTFKHLIATSKLPSPKAAPGCTFTPTRL